ncbi:TIGR02099 family protein [Bacterioplanes sanyensis]|uniref:TIGR02099 family protein n=1 Tax=Bacterioplanes sanyensis TaxID=1249553 RepID=A0A222FI60_9GAMM|nr:YhdP family protein [Bacterioplanes sanyensis]ASP38735.1 TIGR02099 family protein [Bacterioplanes sanyensis]
MRWMRELWLQLWITLVVALVLLALYVSVGRQLIPLLETYQPDAQQWLSDQLQQPVAMTQLQGGWDGLSPLVRVQGLQLGPPGQGIYIDHVEALLDVSASAFYRQPVFRNIEVRGVRVTADEVAEHVWQLADDWQLDLNALAERDSSPVATPANQRPLWLDWLELQHTISFSDWQLNGNGLQIQEQLLVKQLQWRNRGSSRVLMGDVAWGTDGELADIRVTGRLQGPLWPWRAQQGQLFLQVDEQNWQRWVPDALPLGLSLESARAGMMAWLTLEDGQLQQVYSVVTLPELTLATQGEALQLQRGVLRLDGNKQGDGWQARLRMGFEQSLPLSELYLSAINMTDDEKHTSKGWQLEIPGLDLQDSAEFLTRHALLPDEWLRYLVGLQPSGRAEQLRVSLLPAAEPLQLEVQSQLNQVSIAAFNGIPGLSEVDATLQLLPQQGRVRIRDDSLQVWLADVYQQPWSLDNVAADFVWAILPQHYQLQLEQLTAELDGTPVTGEVGLRIARDDSPVEDNTSVLLGLNNAPLTLQRQLVPSILDPELRQWLDQALVSGQVEQAMLALNGSLGDDGEPSIELYLQAQEVQLRYLQDWPAMTDLHGRMMMSSGDIDVWVDSASTLGGELQPHSGRIKLRQQNGEPWLNVVGRLNGNSGDSLRYFTDTPLQQVVNGALDQWQADGPMQAGLVLNMLLAEAEAIPHVQLDIDVSNNRLYLGELDLELQDIAGQLQFDSRTGLTAEQLQGRVFDGAFTGRIESDVIADGDFDLRLSAEGQGQWSAFKQWLPIFLLDPVSGELGYEAQLRLAADKRGGVQFDLHSDLSGTHIDLPYPMGKSVEQVRPLAMSVVPAIDTRIDFNYDDWMKTVVALRNGELHRGQVYIGGSDAFLPSDPGVEVRGRIDTEISGADWFATWQHMQQLLADSDASESDQEPDQEPGFEPDQVESGPLRLIDLQLEQVDMWGIASGASRVVGQQQFGEWQFRLDSPLMTGDIAIAADSRLPLQLELEHIHLPLSEGGEAQAIGPQQDPLQDMIPADVPAFDMRLAELYIGSRNLGRWQLNSRPQQGGLVVDIDDSDLKGLRMLGSMNWRLIDGQHHTELNNVSITSSDIGKVQRQFRQKEVINAEDTRLLAQLSWQGSPMAYNTQSLDGVVSLNMRNGNMAAEGADALKAFGILNLGTINRRLQFDFSDLYQSGVTFDVLKAKANLDDGILNLTEPLVMDGPGSKFLLSGSSNLNYQTLDMKLAVTFPVSGSLPLAAFLTGLAALPVAASIYVTERLVSDELERFTSASYTVRGTWTEPQLTINQAFDNEVDGKTSRTLMERLRGINPFRGEE